MSVWDKLDSSLTKIYLNYQKLREGKRSAASRLHRSVAQTGLLHVTLIYSGKLSDIEALGFRTVWDHGEGRAGGQISLENLERLASAPGVRKLAFGKKPRPTLDVSIPQIKARPGVWDFSAPSFSGTTGAGVIVGIIDTGIDFRHPFFLKTDTPKTTRILRIWDMGLTKQGTETSPDAALLSGGAVAGTYGVEYTDDMINKVLQGAAGATPVRHRDCVGHGTHVASIAAGDGRPAHTYIGVAPEADIVVVKYLSPQQDPTIGGVPIDDHQQFADAVSYILNFAANAAPAPRPRPVVINCSFSATDGAHDGFTIDEVWLTTKFHGAAGSALVVAAGNEAGQANGEADGRSHVRIDFPGPAGDTVEIPFDLYDPRTNRRNFDKCSWENATTSLLIEIYYASGGANVSVELKLPPGSGGPAGFIAGPALGGAPVNGTFRGREYTISNAADAGAIPAVTRNHIEIQMDPFRNRHVTGRYVVKVKADGQVSAHVWCDQGEGFGFEIRTAPALPAIVDTDDLNQIGSNGGADNVITAAAYNAEVTPSLPVAEFSSRGPLVNYNYPAGVVQPTKPDLAAPGVDIDAAKSRDMKPVRPGPTAQMQGTSMAAPHIAGAIALLLQKNKNLTTAQIISTLKTFRATLPIATAEEVGAGRLDAKDAFDNAP